MQVHYQGVHNVDSQRGVRAEGCRKEPQTTACAFASARSASASLDREYVRQEAQHPRAPLGHLNQLHTRRVRSQCIAGVATLMVVPCAACSSASVAIHSHALPEAAQTVPADDSFEGNVVSATGRFRGDGGSVRIRLIVGPSHEAIRPLTVIVEARRCGAVRRCLRLAGNLKGTLYYEARQVPDTGARLRVAASGSIKPIGSVSASGHIHATGFIRRGRETLQLTLASTSGSITAEGKSSVLPGFTSP